MLPIPTPSSSISFLFGESTPLSFTGPSYPGLTLRYTLNGQTPDLRSPVYSGPINVRTPSTVRAAYFTNNGQMGVTATARVLAAPGAVEGSLTPGLSVKTFEGAFDNVPEFGTLTPKAQLIQPNFELPSDLPIENFAVQYIGFLRITADGLYTFWVGSDDGSWLKLSGAKLVDNDGLHGLNYVRGTVMLKKGIYPLEVGFSQRGGDKALRVEIAGPGLARQILPTSMLVHRV